MSTQFSLQKALYNVIVIKSLNIKLSTTNKP